MKAEELLGVPLTADYVPQGYGGGWLHSRNRPIFSHSVIREMLTDPRVIFGLWLIKGPILTNARFKVNCDDEEMKKFVISNLTRFWKNSAARALKAIEWGYSGSEVIYRMREGRVHFDILKDLDSMDIRVVTHEGGVVGISVNNVPDPKGQTSTRHKLYLGGPKKLYHIHWRERHPFYGLSRLYGAHVPWWEQWSDGGYRDIRRLWFHKNAFEGGTMYHPPGTAKLQSGQIVSNKDLAREMIEKKRTGGVLTLPNVTTGDGQLSWQYIEPTAHAIPGGLMEYGESLKRELFEGMGIPPEVFESPNSGFGSATGRQVPEEAFFSVLQECLQWLASDFDQQVLRPVTGLNWSTQDPQYEIVPFGLTEFARQQEQPGTPEAPAFRGNRFTDEQGGARTEPGTG